MTLLSVAREGTREYEALLEKLARRGETDLERVEPAVRAMIGAVRAEGDRAVRRFVAEFEQRNVDALLIHDYGGRAALAALPDAVRAALDEAAKRIRRYHERQFEDVVSFEYEEDGVLLGSRVRALAKVGVYVPGGKASYPSSVLMAAIPASVAGVPHIVVATPSAGPEVRAACHLAGVHAILDAGGAQAVAALAYVAWTMRLAAGLARPGSTTARPSASAATARTASAGVTSASSPRS